MHSWSEVAYQVMPTLTAMAYMLFACFIFGAGIWFQKNSK